MNDANSSKRNSPFRTPAMRVSTNGIDRDLNQKIYYLLYWKMKTFRYYVR